ncbi:MAG: response regulator [Candidatus Rokubacteria bacterium]|nr:response regulator [Candidatus Rokubacteria bacterium]
MAPGASVLLVDDDRELAAALTEYLAGEGYQVTRVFTAAAALRALRQQTLDLLLLDIRLPDGDGIDIMRAALRLAVAPDVILMSGHATVDSALAALEAGAAGYVLKPMDLSYLGSLIRRVVARRALINDNARLLTEQRRRGEEADVLRALTERIAAASDLSLELPQIPAAALQIVEADACAVHRVVGTDLVTLASAGGGKPAAGVRVALADMPKHAAAVRTRAPVTVASGETSLLGVDRFPGTATALIVPAVRADRVVATLTLEDRRPGRRWEPRHVDLVVTVAGLLGLALDVIGSATAPS